MSSGAFRAAANTQHMSYQYAVDVISIQVSCRSLQEPPVPAFIIGDVRLDLVVLPFVGNQHAFNPRHLMDTDILQEGTQFKTHHNGGI